MTMEPDEAQDAMELDAARLMLMRSLDVVRAEFDHGGDDWEYRLLTTFARYLQEIGAESRLLVPLLTIRDRAKTRTLQSRDPGGRGRPTDYESRMVTAAALATVLHKRDGLPTFKAATKEAARITGIDAKRIRNFHDNLRSKRQDLRRLHEMYVEELQTWSNFDTLKDVHRIR